LEPLATWVLPRPLDERSGLGVGPGFGRAGAAGWGDGDGDGGGLLSRRKIDIVCSYLG
jgi:hypothetical protein